MAAKLGSDDVSFRLGAGEVAAVYLGSQEVWSAGPTVPGAPTIDSVDANFEFETLTIFYSPPANDGGSEITGYKYYDGTDPLREIFPSSEVSGVSAIWSNIFDVQSPVRISAVNAVGEGPKSAPRSL